MYIYVCVCVCIYIQLNRTPDSFRIEPTKTRLQYINISVVSPIPEKSWLPQVLNA